MTPNTNRSLVLFAAMLAGLSVAQAQTATTPITSFTNNGLVGVGDLPPTTIDTTGQDYVGGIFSALAVDQNSIQITTDGSGNKTITGTLFGQSDRGYNFEDTGVTSDFHPRLDTFSFTLHPTTGSPGTGGQIVFTNTACTLYHDPNGNLLTGLDATHISTTAANGIANLPQGSNGHLSLDAEGLAFAADGSHYTSDEYGPIIYHFDKTGNLLNVIMPPAAYIPITNGQVNYSAAADPTTSGRVANGGLEGLSMTPDGKYLVAIMQRPLVQDGGTHMSSGSKPKVDGQNVRMLVFSATGANAGQLVHEYVYCCRTFNTSDHGKATGVSEILALNDTQFLVLDRDTDGRGTANNNPPVFKEVVAIDTTGATDLAGTGFDLQGGTAGALGLPVAALATGGTSVAGFGNVVPVQEFYLVSLIDGNAAGTSGQLGRFGQNVNADWTSDKSAILSNNQSVPEKLEGMALIPENDPAKPNSFYLLVGSDNDYIVQNPGVWENGAFVPNSAVTTPGGGESDNTKLYAYEVTLPGASVFVVPPATVQDEPTMPQWALLGFGALLFALAARLLPRRA